jgi:hypothetical protein
MNAAKPLTPSQTQAALAKLERRTEDAKKAQALADAKLAERDELATTLADRGVKYADLAAAMGITVDGVTYVLRKVRRARTTD